MNSLPLTTATAATIIAASIAQAQVTAEVEPNQNKASATAVAAPMQPGDTLTGTSTGSSSSAGAASLDYFRVQTAVAPAGIYRYRLVITTTGFEGHTGSIRGVGQTATALGPWLPAELVGAPTASDSLIQVSSTTTTPARFNQWYGFGMDEELYYRVAGSTVKSGSTTEPYTVTLERQAVTPTAIGNFAPGVLTIKTANEGHTTDTEFWVYDSEFNPIRGYGNDDESATVNSTIPGLLGTTTQSALRREFAEGTYYIAISNFGLSNNQPSPSDDDFRSGNMLDFAGSIANVSPSAGLNLAFSVSDGATVVTVPNTKAGPFDINFFAFTVSTVVLPPNDECLGAIAIGDETLAFDNTDATASAEPLEAACDGGLGPTMAKDLWYVYEATCSGDVTISTCGSGTVGARLAIYDGDCPATGVLVGCDNNSVGCAGGGANVTVPATSGQFLLIRVGASSAVGGAGTLSVSCTAVSPCPADLNGDGQVGAADLAVILNNFGSAGGPAQGDLNGDGSIGAQDLAALLNAFGPCS